MTSPDCRSISVSTLFSRSSNSPRYFAPASSAPRSSESTRFLFKPSGTSSLTIRWAKPSIIAVFPTPGAPINTGLFLVRLCRTCTVRLISPSRPMTGSSLPSLASAVRSTAYFSSDWRCASAFGSDTCSPPRDCKIALSTAPSCIPSSLSMVLIAGSA